MQNLLFGLLTGSMLAVATSGFALLRNTERFLHIAHGQFMVLDVATQAAPFAG